MGVDLRYWGKVGVDVALSHILDSGPATIQVASDWSLRVADIKARPRRQLRTLVSWLALLPTGELHRASAAVERARESSVLPGDAGTTAGTAAGQGAGGVLNRRRTWRALIAKRVATGITTPGNGCQQGFRLEHRARLRCRARSRRKYRTTQWFGSENVTSVSVDRVTHSQKFTPA